MPLARRVRIQIDPTCTPLTGRPNLQNLHPQFDSGRRLQFSEYCESVEPAADPPDKAARLAIQREKRVKRENAFETYPAFQTYT